MNAGVVQTVLDDVLGVGMSCLEAEDKTSPMTPEEEALIEAEIKELERVIADSDEEERKRMEQKNKQADAKQEKAFALRKKELQDKAFYANAKDFSELMRGPMNVYRIPSLGTDHFVVSKTCSLKNGEFIAVWDAGKLSMHPWNRATPTASYPIDDITSRGSFNIMRQQRRHTAAWAPPRQPQAPQYNGAGRFTSVSSVVNTEVPGLQRSFGGFRRFGAGGALPANTTKK